jgi:hypothetical protein
VVSVCNFLFLSKNIKKNRGKTRAKKGAQKQDHNTYEKSKNTMIK